jgi:hypothetical protein
MLSSETQPRASKPEDAGAASRKSKKQSPKQKARKVNTKSKAKAEAGGMKRRKLETGPNDADSEQMSVDRHSSPDVSMEEDSTERDEDYEDMDT